MAILEPGQPAPDFTAPTIGGPYREETLVTLSALQGQRVVLMFYPKDDTPGCTTQACELRDTWDQLPSDVLLFGVSIDPISRHQKFISKYSLPYPLIADEQQEIVRAYGVWVEKSMYGKTYHGTERSTFLLSAEGIIEKVLKKVAPKKHLPLLQKELG